MLVNDVLWILEVMTKETEDFDDQVAKHRTY